MEVGPQTTQSHIIPLQQDNDSHSGAFIFEATNTNPVLHVAEGESESLEIQKRNYCPSPHTHTNLHVLCIKGETMWIGSRHPLILLEIAPPL